MAKRKSSKGNGQTAEPSRPAAADAVNDRLVAFADMLGTMAGTIHGRAEGLVDSRKLSRQLAAVRDRAAHLVDQLAKMAPQTREQKPAPAPRAAAKGRSGGTVDAPGKKHRKPMPVDPNAERCRRGQPEPVPSGRR
jgi:hypothetical protein